MSLDRYLCDEYWGLSFLLPPSSPVITLHISRPSLLLVNFVNLFNIGTIGTSFLCCFLYDIPFHSDGRLFDLCVVMYVGGMSLG